VPHKPAGRGTDGVRQNLGRGDHPRLLRVLLGHRQTAPGKEGTNSLSKVAIDFRLFSHQRRDRFPRQVIIRRSDATGADDQVRLRGRGAQGRGEPLQIVTDLDHMKKLDAEADKFLSEVGRVAIGEMSENQLTANREDIGTHRKHVSLPCR